MEQIPSLYPDGRGDPDLALGTASVTNRDTYLAYVDMPAAPALRGLTDACRDLLRATAELPDTEQGLLEVLAAYRYAVFALVNVGAKLGFSSSGEAARLSS